MGERMFMLAIFAMCILLLNQQMELTEASRPLHIHSPSIPGLSLRKPEPPTTEGYQINPYKKTEYDAFRPTTPGHSPGVGHESPPAA